MEILIELVDLLKHHRVDKIEIIGNPDNYSGKMKLLYDGIYTGRFLNDKDAFDKIYGSGKIANRTFEKLKYRLQDRLINTLFFVDLNKPQFTDSQKAYFYCQKAFAAINILLGRGGRKTAINIAERTLKKTIEFEHTEISLNLLKRLTRHYGGVERNKKKFELYSKLTDDYLNLNNAETLAQQLQAKLSWYNEMTASTQIEIENIAIQFCEQLEEFMETVNSDTFLRFAYYVFITRYEIVGDYNNALLLCEEALEKLNNKKYKNNGAISAFYSRKIIYLIQLKQYKKAEENILLTVKRIPEGTLTWFNLYGNLMKILFITKNYDIAYVTFYKIKKDVSIKSIYKNIKEEWNLYEAYLSFLLLIGKINPIKSSHQLYKKFRINKFLNEVPIHSKDKSGLNIPILIIQLLFLLQQKKYGKVIDKVESLNAYCYRYLKKDDTFRSNCFIKLLLLLPKCNFNRVAVERKSKKLFSKLQSVPLEMTKQSAYVEIIPYDHLWEVVLNMLDMKFYIPKK